MHLLLQVNIPVRVQRWEFQILRNDGALLEAASIGDLHDPLSVVVSRTRKYVVVLIATADVEVNKLRKEAEYISDHISSEGY